MDVIKNLEKLLASGTDNAMLRFGLGHAYFQQGQFDEAVEHLATAVTQDPGYSAAWKVYGRALSELGRPEESTDAYGKGIQSAEKKGDIQAAKEMRVFLRRLGKARS